MKKGSWQWRFSHKYRVRHFENGDDKKPVCWVNYSRGVKLTKDRRMVTCRNCRKIIDEMGE